VACTPYDAPVVPPVPPSRTAVTTWTVDSDASMAAVPPAGFVVAETSDRATSAYPFVHDSPAARPDRFDVTTMASPPLISTPTCPPTTESSIHTSATAVTPRKPPVTVEPVIVRIELDRQAMPPLAALSTVTRSNRKSPASSNALDKPWIASPEAVVNDDAWTTPVPDSIFVCPTTVTRAISKVPPTSSLSHSDR
jgi:hypothetical protein